MKRIISFMLVVCMALALCSCGKKSKKTEYLGENPEAVKQYLEYAEKLEKAGNKEAAAQIYTMIEKAVTADTAYKGRDKLKDRAEYRISKTMQKNIKMFNTWKKVLDK